jgi:hypothetical protein
MPWKQTRPMTERIKMISEYLRADYSVADLGKLGCAEDSAQALGNGGQAEVSGGEYR